MRVLVCGTRVGGSTYDLFEELKELSPYAIIHGGAREGGDKMASEFCHEYDVAELVYKADWETYGKRAGYKRNIQMLEMEEPHMVVARWDGKSNGTRHTIEEAVKRGIPVRIVPVG